MLTLHPASNFGREQGSLRRLLLLSTLFWPRFVCSLSSEQCLTALQQAIEAYGDGNNCHEAMCGSLDTSSNLGPFFQRMSAPCQDKIRESQHPEPLTNSLRVPDGAWLKGMLRSQLASLVEEDEVSHTPWQRCSTGFQGRFATNPVVVENHKSANFVMCTVPKAGCTLLRSLLYVLTHSELETSSFTHAHVHEVPYPTTWHYRNGDKHVSDAYPTFVVGRNPYIRLVSGFLDKMVLDREGHDWPTMTRMNTDLGRDPNLPFEATPESFAEFVRLLRAAPSVNQHFQSAVTVCGIGHFPYRYFLRIEEMAEWYPCLVDGLQLQEFTESGWQASNGAVQHGPEHPDCWWKPVGSTCDTYFQQTHDDTGAAIPGLPTDKAPGAQQRDTHDTGAAGKWQKYYTQEVADLVYDIYREDFLAFGYERFIVPESNGF